MGLFSPKRADDKTTNSHAPTSVTRVAGSAAPMDRPRVGIDHAIMLMRCLPTDKHLDVVVTVLKTTLESLGISVVDIVADAAQRLQHIEMRAAQLKGEIAGLEQEIARRTEEIAWMNAAHAETTIVMDYLEQEEAEVLPSGEP
jgi:hypothetical protein